MKIAVLGAGGQLGHDLVPRLRGEVVPLSRAEINLDQPETIAPTLAAVRPDVFVNCAAYNFVDRAESEPDLAFRTNTWGVRELARACRERDCRLVHFSSDYVFGLDEQRSRPLGEGDLPGPVSAYGLSKLGGEYFVLGESPRNLVVRTCGLYGVWGSGGKGGNFVETILRLAHEGKPLRVVNDQQCTPTYTADLAETVASLLSLNAVGIYHATSSGDCTWYEFASEILRLGGLRASLNPIGSAEYGAKACRPRYSVLSTEKLISFGITRPPHWMDALSRYFQERQTK